MQDKHSKTDESNALVQLVRTLEVDRSPDDWPTIRMRDVSALADAVESLTARLDECHKMRNELIAALGKKAVSPHLLIDVKHGIITCGEHHSFIAKETARQLDELLSPKTKPSGGLCGHP